MKKWIAMLLALTMMCLCGCDNKEAGRETNTTPPAQTTAPVETTEPDMEMVGLSVWVVADGIWADTEALDALLSEFNAYYPNIIVNVEHKTAGELSGSKPDMVLASAEQIAAWNAQGGMADLSDLWANGLRGDAYEAVETACANGETGRHTVPLGMDPYCMAVNQSMLEDTETLSYLNTVNHTWNTANFLKAVQALSDSGMDTVGTIFCKDLQEDDLTRLLVTNLYDGSFVDRKTGAYNVAEGEMGRALAALAQQEGIRLDVNADGERARAEFLNGATAFTLNWSAALQMEHASDANILFMHYPSSDSRPETWAEVYGFGIFDNGDAVKVAASKTFVTHMSGSSLAVRATGLLPARDSQKDAYDGTDLEKTVSELNKLLSFLTERESTGQFWDTARNEWLEMLQGLASAGENWQEVLNAAQRDLNSLFPELFPEETEASAPTE